MARVIKVFIQNRNGMESKDVSPEEAESILKETYKDDMGGLVFDRKTGEAISQIGPDTEEILIIDQVLGGG